MKWIVRASAHVLYVKASISTFMRRFSRVGGTILSFVVTFSHADAILNRVTEGSGLLGTISSGTWGYSFTVGDQGLSVSSLGLYDYKGDQHGGLSAAHPVGIWDPVGSLLVSVTVPAGTSGTLEASYLMMLGGVAPGGKIRSRVWAMAVIWARATSILAFG